MLPSLAEQLKAPERLQGLNSRRPSYLEAEIDSGWNSEGSASGDGQKNTRRSSSAGMEMMGGIGSDDGEDVGAITFEEMMDGG